MPTVVAACQANYQAHIGEAAAIADVGLIVGLAGLDDGRHDQNSPLR